MVSLSGTDAFYQALQLSGETGAALKVVVAVEKHEENAGVTSVCADYPATSILCADK